MYGAVVAAVGLAQRARRANPGARDIYIYIIIIKLIIIIMIILIIV